MRGKFIVFYGPNDVGKTIQANLLVNHLNRLGIDASYLKYPIYDLFPTGPRLDGILRRKIESLTAEELQRVFAQNRRDYQPELEGRLASGVWVVAEDYVGTGIAWGATFGVPLDVLEEMNVGLTREDLAILLDGERFIPGIERIHLHEESGLWGLNRGIHRFLAEEYGWRVVDSSFSEEKVSQQVWEVVSREFAI